MVKCKSKTSALKDMGIEVDFRTPFIPLSIYDNKKVDSLLMIFPDDKYCFEQIGLPHIGDISSIISDDKMADEFMGICESKLNDMILHEVKFQYEKLTPSPLVEEKEVSDDPKTNGTDKGKKTISVRAYLIAVTPKKYEVAMQYLYEATSNDTVSLIQKNTQEQGKLLDIPTLFNTLHEKNCPEQYIPVLIKLIQYFHIHRLPNISLVSISPKRLAVKLGVPLSKIQLALHWFIEHQFIRQKIPSENLYLRAAFFSSFYQQRPKDCNFPQYSQFSPYPHKRWKRRKRNRKLRYLAEQYTVKMHDENECKMKPARNLAYKTHLRQFNELKEKVLSGDTFLKGEIHYKRLAVYLMTSTLFKDLH
ncbi:hypothetical protein [Vibrio algivorus]|uniref:Uncharacterized protein n=1 Tax=Vibrio algivorus TaxID=1667024 RepID=A0A557PFI8_9VIBR|nr:hypothetical protein [Vibrio algivorus]TVO39428.1 hypothetical protein FOF44_02245 [Vibrio algivorus]